MRSIPGFESVSIKKEYIRKGSCDSCRGASGGCTRCCDEQQVAFVVFASRQSAEKAVDTFDYFEFDEKIGSHLRVEHVGSYNRVYNIQWDLQLELIRCGWAQEESRKAVETFCPFS
jgi:hypothetical protein